MGQAQPARNFLTEEDYYVFCEQNPDGKYEYYQGEIFAMAGAMPNHNLVAVNIIAALKPQAKKRGCSTFNSDQRIRIPASGLTTFPDISVVCGPLQFAPDRRDTITNPALLVEVLSRGTEDYDRGNKFEHYKLIPSLMEYLMVSSDACFAALHTRQPNGSWTGKMYEEMSEVLSFPHSGFALPVEELYDGVPLPVIRRKPGAPEKTPPEPR